MTKTEQAILDYLQHTTPASMNDLFLNIGASTTAINKCVGKLLEKGVLEKVVAQNCVCVQLKLRGSV